jgi:hypothetical protein
VRSFRASTIAEITAMDVTSANGIAVHAISMPVCPWVGGPSESSSGETRNFQPEYRSTERTIA